MKMISAEKAREFINQLENIFYNLQISDEIWDQFDTMTDLYFGGNLRDIARDDMIEEIAIIWCIEDVQSVRPDLTDQQASNVLKTLKENHDADVGINWEIIEIEADTLFVEELAKKTNETIKII